MNMKAVLGLIMGGGQGSRLYPLTRLRAKPAVLLAGKYRLIDIPISNCLHAGIDKIAMGADYYETEADRAENKRLGRPDIGIDEGTVIEGAIIDKNARIGRNVHVPASIRPPRQRNGQLGGPRRPGGYPEGRGN